MRRFTEEDIGDAVFVARKYKIGADEIEKKAEESIRNSPKDTALFIFRKNIAIFISKIAGVDRASESSHHCCLYQTLLMTVLKGDSWNRP